MKAATSDAECNEFSFFIKWPPYRLKSVTIHGKETDLTDFTDQDFSYVASALDECRDRIRNVPIHTDKYIQGYRVYYDHENVEKGASAKRVLDSLRTHMIGDDDVARVKSIGQKYPALRTDAEQIIKNNDEQKARFAAAQEVRNQQIQTLIPKRVEPQIDQKTEQSTNVFTAYLAVYLSAKRCADEGYVFNQEIVENIAAVVKEKGRTVPQPVKDQAWQVMQNAARSVNVNGPVCSQAMQQAMYMLPQDVLTPKDAPKNPF